MNRDVTAGIGGDTAGGIAASASPRTRPDRSSRQWLEPAELMPDLTGTPVATLLAVGDPTGTASGTGERTGDRVGPTSDARQRTGERTSERAGGHDRGSVGLLDTAATPRPPRSDAPGGPGGPGEATGGGLPRPGHPAREFPSGADLLTDRDPDVEGPAARPGLPLLADPRHGEPVLLSSLAAAGALTCWASAAPVPGWLATAGLLPLSVWAVSPGRFGKGTAATLLRALLLLAGSLALSLTTTELNGLAVVWVIAVGAFYPVLLPREAGTTVISLGVLTLCVPVAVTLLRGDILAAQDPAALAGTVGAAAVVAGLGGAAGYLRGALADTALLAEQRRAIARTAHDELVRVTSSDALTALPNRSTLLRRIARGLALGDVISGPLALFVLEVDHVTAVTNTLGPSAGDDVLCHIARRLRAAMPAEDVVARIGSRRFAVLVEGVGPEGCAGMARRMTALLEEPITGLGRTVSVTCSIGIAVAGPDLSTPDDILRAAEEAVDAARRNGRTRWATFDQAMRAHARSRGTLEIELREAVRAERIGAAFQPVLALGHHSAPDRLAGVELVARWSRDDGTAVPALRFMPLAEDLGLTSQLGLQLLDHGLAALQRWRDQGLRVGALSIDVSPSQLDDPDFARTVSDRLRDRMLTPSHLVVEVPAARFVDTEQARGTLAMLRSLGVGVVVDGFGRSGISLVALRQLPVTAVKLDRAITANLTTDATMAATVLSLCRPLGLRCIADGVECQSQLDAARDLGVDAVQGSFVARPVLAEDLPGLIRP